MYVTVSVQCWCGKLSRICQENWFREPLVAEPGIRLGATLLLWLRPLKSLKLTRSIERPVPIPVCSAARGDPVTIPNVQCESPGRVMLRQHAGTKISQSHQKYLVVRDQKNITNC